MAPLNWIRILPLGVGILLGLAACSPATESTSKTYEYLFVGHAYDHHGEGIKVDPRLEAIDYGDFDRLILGGDVCSEPFQYRTTLEYLDSLFDLGSPHTYYVVGNHDARNENAVWYHEFTHHPTYYTTSELGLVTVQLNTTLNPGDCAELDAQFELLKRVCDTISDASHLLILQHHNTFNGVPGIPPPWNMANWPFLHWDAHCGDGPPSYLASVYPLLKKVQQRGVQVVNVMADIGFRQKRMAEKSDDGIYFLASGIDNTRFARDLAALDSLPKDQVLIFQHTPSTRSLEWKFHDLDSLSGTNLRSINSVKSSL